MSIDAIIYCFNDAPLADCLNCPHFLERSGSRAGCRVKRMGEARKIVEKYQKIKEQVDIAIDKENFAISDARLIQIREIINGDDN